MNQFKQIFTKRLERIGIEIGIIPAFIKSLSNIIFLNSDLTLLQVNDRLRLSGWEDVELDYHTFQLAIAFLEEMEMLNEFKK